MRSTPSALLRGLLLAALVTVTASAAIADGIAAEATYWRRQEEGWFWYLDPPPVRAPKSVKTPVAATFAPKSPEIVAHEAL